MRAHASQYGTHRAPLFCSLVAEAKHINRIAADEFVRTFYVSVGEEILSLVFQLVTSASFPVHTSLLSATHPFKVHHSFYSVSQRNQSSWSGTKKP